MEVFKIHYNYNCFSVQIKTKIDNRVKYFDVRMRLQGELIQIETVGVANNKNLDYKFIQVLSGKYRYMTREEKAEQIRKDIREIASDEVLLLALNTLKDSLRIDTDFFNN